MVDTSSVPLLSVRNLTKRYGAMAAVDDLSFDVMKGELLGIGGPNGAGKTTLFDTISGVSPIASGSIAFAGRELTGLAPEKICHLGIARTFQLNAVFDTMTVWDNVVSSAYFGTKNRSIPSLRFDRASYEQAEEALEITGLSDLAGRVAADLPILQRKLLMLAGAVASRPALLLLDEPVGGLNQKEIEQCSTVFRRLRDFHGMTIILIEHVMSFMTALSDRIMIMHHGAKLYEGAGAGLADNPDVVEVYLGLSGASALRPRAEGAH